MIKPVGSRILVADPPADNQRDSGLIVPDHYDRVKVGIVMDFNEIAIGLELNLSKGDVIYYSEGCEVRIKDMVLVDAHHVVATEKMED